MLRLLVCVVGLGIDSNYSTLLLFIVIYLIVMTQCNMGVRTVLYAVRIVM